VRHGQTSALVKFIEEQRSGTARKWLRIFLSCLRASWTTRRRRLRKKSLLRIESGVPRTLVLGFPGLWRMFKGAQDYILGHFQSSLAGLNL